MSSPFYRITNSSHCQQQVAKQTGNIGYVLHAEKDEAHLIFGGFKFTTEYNAKNGLLVYNYVNTISKFTV